MILYQIIYLMLLYNAFVISRPHIKHFISRFWIKICMWQKTGFLGFNNSSVGFSKNEDFNRTCSMECCWIDNCILICVLTLGREACKRWPVFSYFSTDFLYDGSMDVLTNKLFDFYSFILTIKTFKNTCFNNYHNLNNKKKDWKNQIK